MNEENKQRINKQAWLIALLFALPMIAALLMTLVPALKPGGGTRNYGELIEPAVLIEQARFSSGPQTQAQPQGDALWLRGRWTLLQTVRGTCDQPCVANLDKMGRLHQALGRHHQRLQRVLLSDQSSADQALEAIPDLQLIAGAQSQGLLSLLDSVGAGSAGLVLIDPWGHAMMHYPANYDGSAALKDLQRLMRYAKPEAERRALEEAQQALDLAADG